MKELNQEIKQQLGFLDPIKVLELWLKQALQKEFAIYRNSWPMTLSTCYNNQVSSRVVLLKELKKSELIFYSNYLSEKGSQIQKNPKAAVNFYWPHLNKQVRIQGIVKKTNRKQSLEYWKSRNRDSQISQWISKQSQTVSSKKTLTDLKKQTELKFKNKPISCPKHWGGYKLQIKKIEFWIDGTHRLHDRFLFQKQSKQWKIQRLFP